MNSGRLNVSVLGFAKAGAPVVTVRDSDLSFERTVRADQAFELPVGNYVVTAALPNGERVSRVAEVSPEGSAEVTLRTPDRPARERLASVYQGGGVAVPEADEDAPLVRGGGEGARNVGPSPPQLYSRFHSGSGDGIQLTNDDLQLDCGSTAEDRGEMEFAATARSASALAQFATRDRVPVNIALPMSAESPVTSCHLHVSANAAGEIGVAATPNGPAELELAAGYLETGQLEAVAAVRAEELLQAKIRDPFAAAIGGYGLLRVGELKRLHDWPDNLANWFGWLPDGAVIAAEQAALTGDERGAAKWFAEAVRRGTPVFSDGLSILCSRLRAYTAAEKLPPPLEEVADRIPRLVGTSPFADFTRLTTTFVGLDPADPARSQTPLSNPEAEGFSPLPWEEKAQ